jgi:polar amino acid transport system substrate-binding protein
VHVFPVRSTFAMALAVLVVVAACGSSSTSPSTGGSAKASASAAITAGASPSAASPSASDSAAPTPIANVPSDQLVFAGRLLVCSDLSYVPQEYREAGGNPAGSDVEIVTEIGRRLGLTVAFVDTIFTTTIDALNARKCDIIVSAQPITASRKKQVDMITYFQAGQSFLVGKGNPQNIKTQQDLCGKVIGAQAGSSEVDFLNGTGDYDGRGLSAQCTKAAKAKITVKTFQKDDEALVSLQAGAIDAYFTDSPLAAYFVVLHPDAVELSGLTLGVVKEGISVGKDHPDLKAAVQRGLASMVNDGTYLQILQKWGQDAGNVFAK